MDESDHAKTERAASVGIAAELEAEGFLHARVVGQGGFGIVYQLDQTDLRRTVAIKVLQSDVDPANRARFLREQQAMGTLSEHPNIVAILQAGVTRTGHPYLVMPFYENGSLDEKIRRDGPLGWQTATTIGIRIAGALETAHRLRILHRDVKPSNILLTDYGEPTLADFGIARMEGGFETSANIIVGTPTFTPPEVLLGQSPTAASDIYALGASLFCALTGHAAFERRSGEQAISQFFRILREPIPNLREQGVPDDVCAAIERAMARDPAERPPTAAEFGEELRLVQRRHSLPLSDMALAEKTGEAGGDRLDIASEDHALSRRTESGTRHAGVLSMPIGPVTKYRPPRNIRRMVERSRLTDLLHLGGERRLIAIHGPAGFGKSTLAVQWSSHLKEMGASVAWLAIDRDDNNLVWFLAHVLEAIRKVRPLRIEELVCALEEHGDDAERFVLTSLIDDIHESGERLALVIDDWHRVTDAPTIASLEYLIDNSCHHLQLIVTSRNRSGLPLSRTRVHDELVEIDSSQLKFDIDEAQDFFNELGELALSRTEVTQIVRSTDGWAAALQLASLSLRGRSDAAAFIGAMSGRHHAIGDYLAENVLDSLDPPIVDFLLSICVTERICGELALVLTQGRYGQAMLEEVERRDLFLYQADDEGEWYRFSGVFSEFLRGRLERDHPERKNDLHRIAFQWFADRRLLREAVDHALAAGDAEQAITLVEECGMYLVDHGQMVTLLGLIDKLPPREILDRPRLQIAIAQANVSLHRSAAAVSALDLADSSLKKTADDQVNHALVVEANVVRGVLDVTMDRIGNVELLVSPCLQEPDSQSAWTVSVAANIKSFVHICRFEFDAARQLQDWAAHYHRHAEGTFTEVYGYCYAGLAAFEQLDIPAAEMSFLHALQTARESMGFHSHAARMASALLGELRYEQNRIKEAERLLDESHAMGSEIALVDFMIAIYVIGSRVKVLAGDISAAAELLNEGKTIARSMDLPRLAAHIKSEEMRQGPSPVANAGRTAKVYQGGGIEAIAAQVMEASAIRQMLRIQESPTIDAACGRARQLVQEIARDNRPRALLQAKILLAVCLIETGRQAEAEEILIPVVQRCAELGLVRLVADAGPQLMRSLAQIREVAPSFIHEVETAGSEGINPTQ